MRERRHERVDRRRLLLICESERHRSLSVAPGCGWGPTTTYGTSRGKSLNGTSVLPEMFENSGHEVRTAIRLNEELADWAGGIVRFAPYPGLPLVTRPVVPALARRRTRSLVNLCRARLRYRRGVLEERGGRPRRSSDGEPQGGSGREARCGGRLGRSLAEKGKARRRSLGMVRRRHRLDPAAVVQEALAVPGPTGIDAVAAALDRARAAQDGDAGGFC